MKRIFSLLLIVGALLLSSTVYAQTTINTTTLSTAITTPTPTTDPATNVTLASLGSGSTAVTVGQVFLIDLEAFRVRSVPTSGTTITATRAYMSTKATTHAANAVVYYGNSQAFLSGVPGIQAYAGSCTPSYFYGTPMIDVANGTIGECDSVTLQWKWTRLSAPFGTVRPYHSVANTNYTIKNTDEIIGVTSLTTGITLTMPAATGLAGKTYMIQDETGNAGTATATITISGTFNASATKTILTGYGVIKVHSNGTLWMKEVD